MSTHKSDAMTALERRVAFTLGGIFSLRMLGLFMILPVFAVYARELEGYSATLAGLAIGIYGLTQAIMQIPMGRLSDKLGRKPIILLGLTIFAVGSVVAALSSSLTGVIIGRALQGAGAIASAVMALAADLTREEHRVKVMAVIGMSIGTSFGLAMVLGPVLHGWFGVQGIFWVTAVLAGLGMLVVVIRVPTPVQSRFHRDTEVEWNWLWKVLGDGQLLRLDLGVLLLHLILTATFTAIPRILHDNLGYDVAQHWRVYLPVMFVAVVSIVPFIILAERQRRMKAVLFGAVLAIALASLGLYRWHSSTANTVMMLWLFFAGFNLLEAMLPSLVAKTAPAAHKGTAMGAFSTSQFFGAFLGGTLGGWVSGHLSVADVFLVNAVLALLWLGLVLSMRPLHYLSSQLINVGKVTPQQAEELVARLTQINGVAEVVVIPEDGVAYLKVDNKALDREALAVFSAA